MIPRDVWTRLSEGYAALVLQDAPGLDLGTLFYQLGVPTAFLICMVLGLVIPRPTHNSMIADLRQQRDAALAELQRERDAREKSDAEKSEVMRQLLEWAKEGRDPS